ncbi:MAG TPA: cytochrome c-type biogenesis protein CcmH [Alphaproteobacteria bacterium]|jgi:cytochrome c-type biogenesis protein CcmH|nr:cytochrome c-type biogenesis protein CcmH [Alphaproteobacteria bacterium]
MQSNIHWQRLVFMVFVLYLGIAFISALIKAQQPLSPQLIQQQAYQLYTELRCPVCQGQSLAESPAELAADMRALILERLSLGEKPEMVIAFLKDRYGDAISFHPPFTGRTYLLWILPFVVLIGGGYVVFRRIHHAQHLNRDT